MTSTDISPALPKYLDLCRLLEERIAAGELKPGDRLPSFARMRAEHGATAATVERVLRTLEAKGLARREPSRGVFVTAAATADDAARTGGVIGVMTQGAYREHPYYSKLFAGVQAEAQRLGLELLLLLENSVASRDKIDGLLLLGGRENPLRQIPLAMPRVALMGETTGASAIVADDAGGIRQAMRHLLELGHRRIGFLTLGALPRGVDGPPNADAASSARFAAYRAALREAGIRPDPRWVKPLREGNAAFAGFSAAGRAMMLKWLQADWAELGCTALLAQNDEVAVQAIQVLQEVGLDVPGRVSVVGFDDTDYCTWIRPHLTTVNAGLEAAGASAVRHLLEKMNHPPAPGSAATRAVTTIPVKLVVRESTGPAHDK